MVAGFSLHDSEQPKAAYFAMLHKPQNTLIIYFIDIALLLQRSATPSLV